MLTVLLQRFSRNRFPFLSVNWVGSSLNLWHSLDIQFKKFDINFAGNGNMDLIGRLIDERTVKMIWKLICFRGMRIYDGGFGVVLT